MALSPLAQVAQGFQAGQESTFATSTSPTQSFPTFRFTPKPNKGIKLITPSASKAPTLAVGGKETTSFAVHSDGLTYDEITWVTETMIKTQAATSTNTARTRAITPTYNVQDSRKSFTSGWGQTTDLWQANACFFDKMTIKNNPDGVMFDGEMTGQDIKIRTAALPSATQINKIPILIDECGVFSQSAFGAAVSNSTALDLAMEVEIAFDATVNPVMRIRQGEKSYMGTVEIAPGWKVNLTLGRNQTGGDLTGDVFNLADWRAGTLRYVKWQALSTTQFADSASANPYELTFDMCLVVGAPFELGEFNGLAVVKFPCSIAADSAGNWLKITEVNQQSTFS